MNKNNELNIEEKYYLKRIERENRRLNTYMSISAISILLVLTSIALNDNNIISESIRDKVIVGGTLTVILDNIVYLMDKVKNCIYDKIDKPITLKKTNNDRN